MTNRINSPTPVPEPSFDQTTTAWLIEEILDRIDTQLVAARLDIDEVLRLAAQELPKEADTTFTEMIAELAEKTTKLAGFFADIPTIPSRSLPSGYEQAPDMDEGQGDDDTGTAPLSTGTKQSYLELAAADARTYAMIARASVANAVRYGETITPPCTRLIEEGIEQLEQTLRITASDDPDAR